MIKLVPEINLNITCPSCDHEVQASDWMFTGMHVMTKCDCKNCGKLFLSELPINAGLFYPGVLDVKTGMRCDKMPFDNWYLSGLQEAYNNQKDEKVDIEIINNKELGTKPILILNTIDSTYGHALYELFNASYYLKQTEFDLVIIVQKSLLWLTPKGSAQVWVVDMPFSKAIFWYNYLIKSVKELTSKASEVYICRSFVQADDSDFNIVDYIGINPFPLEDWDTLLEKPTITFVWRTDRFWKRVLPKVFDNRFTRKLFPSVLKKVSNYLQFQWILKFSSEIRKQIPKVDFAIAGMDDRSFALPEWVIDLRYPTHEDETARLQAERYSKSHLVIGCNGSSLLLPGCLSGGVINIVPGDMWAVSAGTFPFRITSIGDTHFRYLMLPAEVSIKRLVSIATSVLRDRSYIQLQTSPPWRDHNAEMDSYEWSKFRLKAFSLHKFFKGSEAVSKPK